jgi:hypothetical protein
MLMTTYARNAGVGDHGKMATKVACIHTGAPLIELFRALAASKAPNLRILQMLDEPILERIRTRGRLDDADVDRLASHVRAARDAGAKGVLVTCSTLSPLVDSLPVDLREGVLKVDDPLMRTAVARGGKIVLAATNKATLEPSSQTLQSAAAKAGKRVDPEIAWIPDAFDAFLRSDFETHDRLVIAALIDLAERADTIILAQASMARIVERLPEAVRPKVLSSPELALDALVELAG